MILEKLVRIGCTQLCYCGKSLVFFNYVGGGVWEQITTIENMLVETLPTKDPLVYFVDDFLNCEESLEIELKRIKRGVYKPK